MPSLLLFLQFCVYEWCTLMQLVSMYARISTYFADSIINFQSYLIMSVCIHSTSIHTMVLIELRFGEYIIKHFQKYHTLYFGINWLKGLVSKTFSHSVVTRDILWFKWNGASTTCEWTRLKNKIENNSVWEDAFYQS